MNTSPFKELVEKELAIARLKHPGTQSSLHEGYAVLLEEVEEFWSEVKKKDKNRNYNHILSELVQISAMAQRTAEDIVFNKIEYLK